MTLLDGTPATTRSLEALTVGPIATNAYLVGDPTTRDAVLIDPGAEAERLLGRLRAGDWNLREIWLTHAHFDHIGAVDDVVEALGDVPVRLHVDDRDMYGAAKEIAWAFSGIAVAQPRTPTLDIAHGDELHAGSIGAAVRHVPGHAPGHVVFVLHGARAVMAGDTLFRGGIGRTDFPNGDHDLLIAGIRRELLSLASDTVVWPGHGPATTIAREVLENGFLQG
ncbi:MAG: MBL fold metallo-hydrolase [Trueperaceae bacterium]|nr:MBL fold metallo-hydrolase [Trueperaceae bacterium]